MNMVVVVEALVIDMLPDVRFIVVGVIVVALKLVVSVSYTVDVPAARAFDLFIDAVTDIMLGVLPEIGNEVLTDVNASALVVTALGFPVPTPLEEFSRCAAFDCRPMAALECDRALHT